MCGTSFRCGSNKSFHPGPSPIATWEATVACLSEEERAGEAGSETTLHHIVHKQKTLEPNEGSRLSSEYLLQLRCERGRA